MEHPPLETPLKVTLELTNCCNLDCKHCYKACSRILGKHELNTDQWKSIVDDLVNSNIINVFIEGGEPLFRSDAFQILEYLRGKMLVWLRTNGTLVNDEVATRLVDAGIGWLCVDILSADEHTHDYLTGVPGSFQQACNGVTAAVRAGLPTTLVLVLTRYSIDHLQEYMELAARLGARKVGILRLYPLGKAKLRWKELSVSVPEAMAALRKIKVPDGLTFAPLTQSWHPNNSNCCWQNAAVNYFGRSIGCPYLREFVDFGNLLSTPLLSTWNDPLYTTLRDAPVVGGCSQCSSNTMSEGGCRATAYAFTGRWNAPDPYCEQTMEGVDVRELPQRLLSENGEPKNSTG